MDRIDRVLTLANAKMNSIVCDLLKNEGASVEATFISAYEAAYLDTVGHWRLANNEIEPISVRTLAEVQEKATEGMQDIWFQF